MVKRTCNSNKSEGVSKKCFYELFVISFALVTLLGLSNAPVVEGQDGSKASSKLLAKAQAAGSVRVIVRLNTSFQSEGRLSGPQAAISQQARISRVQNQLHDAVSKHNVKGIKKFKHIPYSAMEVDSAALGALMANPLVASIEEDIPVPPTLAQSVPLIKADQAWSLGTPYTGSGWAVAILDTGVDKTHSFFPAGKVVAEACYSTTSARPSTTVCPNGLESQTGAGAGGNCGGADGTGIDGCQHGTHVAGIAAGNDVTNSIYGVAKEASIIAIQIFSSFTNPADCGGATPCVLSWTSDQIAALEYVYSLRTTYNIAAVNMSLGSGYYTSNCDSTETASKAAIDTLRSVGIATVIASGNHGYSDGLSAPACISTAVSVGASTKTDIEASYSNYHPTLLSLFAPGSAITSSIPGGTVAAWNGTSMATPHVAGAWAILKQKSPAASVDSILNSLQTTGATVTTKAGDLAGGAIKRIDVLAALTFPPSGLSGSASSISAISLSWTDNSSDEAGFKIERKTAASGTYLQIGTTGAGATAYADFSLSEGTTYYYRVRAYDAGGDSAYSNETNVTTLLAAPTGFSASPASTTQISLSWTDNSSHESTFRIERATVSGGPYTQIGTADANTTTYNDTGLTAGTTYYYRAKAYNEYAYSAYSNEANATTSSAASGGGGGGGCFIATAAFGTPLEKHVRILREFRDRCLLTSSAGQAFVKFYYDVSPPIAGKIAQNEGLRFITRCSLMPFVGMAYLMVNYGATATLLFVLSFILMMSALVWIIRRKMMLDGK